MRSLFIFMFSFLFLVEYLIEYHVQYRKNNLIVQHICNTQSFEQFHKDAI